VGLQKALSECRDDRFAPDHPRQWDGESWLAHASLFAADHRRDEKITAAGDILHVPYPGLTASEGLAQRVDVHSESAFLDDRVGPDAGDELALHHDLAGPFDQGEQDFPRAAAEA
jgi:hypothetical protein